jgi:hypothetical protein
MIHYWKIYHETKKLLENLPCKKDILENLPFNGKISMAKYTNGKFPCLYGYAYR